MPAEWITIKEAAEILRVSKRTLWRRIKAGKYATLEEPNRGNKTPRLVSKEDILRD